MTIKTKVKGAATNTPAGPPLSGPTHRLFGYNEEMGIRLDLHQFEEGTATLSDIRV